MYQCNALFYIILGCLVVVIKLKRICQTIPLHNTIFPDLLNCLFSPLPRMVSFTVSVMCPWSCDTVPRFVSQYAYINVACININGLFTQDNMNTTNISDINMQNDD